MIQKRDGTLSTMASPRVNILMPTYEPRPEHLRTAIESVRAQTCEDWTLFIRDDASGGDVRAIVEPYLSDPRITFERGTARLGIGGNWNACLHHALALRPSPTPAIQFLFQDDRWDPGYLQAALSILETNPAIGFVAVDHEYACDGEIAAAPRYQELRMVRRDLMAPGRHHGKAFLQRWLQRGLHPNLIGEPSFVMLRRSLVERVGPFREDMPQFLDVEYWARALAVSDVFFHPHPLGAFRVHSGSASVRNDAEGRGLYDRFRCLEHLGKTLPHDLRSSARQALRQHFEVMAEKLFRRAAKRQTISLSGMGSLRSFALRHPLLVARSMLRVARRGF